MKTRHLFAAMMLPALFAACSNEEWETLENKPSDLSDRPLAGDVQLSFTKGADTRLDKDFKWENGDKIGACLMDDYIEAGTGAPEQSAPWMKYYKFVDYNHTNYRYTYDKTDAVWENEDLLSSGNYFFYYPYDINLNSRIAFEKVLNANQVLKGHDEESLRDLINDNQMYLGYNFVEGATFGDTQPLNVSMSPVFAFPAFTITNTGGKTRTIQKIALQHTGNNGTWNLVATVDPTFVKTDPATEFMKDPTKAVVWSGETSLYKDVAGTAKQIQVTMPEGTTLAQNESLNTYIVVPAGAYGMTDKVTLYVYTTEGVVTTDLSEKHINSGTTNQYNVTNDVAFADVQPYKIKDKYFRCNITFDDLGVETPSETTVSSTEDLDMYLDWFKNYSGTGGTALEITTLGDDVELSKASYDILNGNKTLKATFVGNLTLAEGVGENVLDLITIDKTTATVLTNKSTIKVPTSLGDKIKLVNKGTATLEAVAATYVCDFQNDGVMNINPKQEGDKTVDIELTSNNEDFVNNGTLNILNNLTLTGNYGIYNLGKINIKAGQTTGKISNIFKEDLEKKTYIAGKLEVTAGATWQTKGANGVNQGVITNYGSIKVDISGSNSYVNSNKVNQACTFMNPVVYIPAYIYNYGSIQNITNNSEVAMMNGNASYTTVNVGVQPTAGQGFVDNTVCNNKIVAHANEVIYCQVTKPMTFTEVNDFVANSGSQKVKFVEGAEKLTIDAKTNADGDIIENGVIVVNQIEIDSDLDIVTANNKAYGRIYAKNATEATITINKDVTATLQDYVKLYVNSTSTATKIDVDGTFVVTTNAYISKYKSSTQNFTFDIAGSVYNYGRVAGTQTEYKEGTTTGWNSNASTKTAMDIPR